MTKANASLRKRLKSRNIPLWQLGQYIGVSEITVVRWFRIELDDEHKRMIEQAIDEIEMHRSQERK